MRPPLPTLASEPNPDDANLRDATLPKSPIRPGLSYARALNLSANQKHSRVDSLSEETEQACPVEVATTDNASQPAGHAPRTDPAAYLHLPSGTEPVPIVLEVSTPSQTVATPAPVGSDSNVTPYIPRAHSAGRRPYSPGLPLQLHDQKFQAFPNPSTTDHAPPGFRHLASRRKRRSRQNVSSSLTKHDGPFAATPPFASISPRMMKHGHGPRRITLSNSSPHSSGKKTLNVDSPSFTPSNQHLATKKSTFSTQAASAAPFTPRGADGKPSG
jgi:hypothetical protein